MAAADSEPDQGPIAVRQRRCRTPVALMRFPDLDLSVLRGRSPYVRLLEGNLEIIIRDWLLRVPVTFHEDDSDGPIGFTALRAAMRHPHMILCGEELTIPGVAVFQRPHAVEDILSFREHADQLVGRQRLVGPTGVRPAELNRLLGLVRGSDCSLEIIHPNAYILVRPVGGELEWEALLRPVRLNRRRRRRKRRPASTDERSAADK